MRPQTSKPWRKSVRAEGRGVDGTRPVRLVRAQQKVARRG